MAIEDLKSRLPEYAKDLKLNLSGLINAPEGMSEQQLWGCLLAAAIASRNELVTASILEDAVTHLDEAALAGVKGAAAIMGMNNIYYRFVHMVSDKEYSTMPAKLRMNVMMNPGVPKVDFELWALVVSAVNGCQSCVDSHERVLREKELDRTAIQHAVRIAAVVHAIAATMDAEQAMTNSPA